MTPQQLEREVAALRHQHAQLLRRLAGWAFQLRLAGEAGNWVEVADAGFDLRASLLFLLDEAGEDEDDEHVAEAA